MAALFCWFVGSFSGRSRTVLRLSTCPNPRGPVPKPPLITGPQSKLPGGKAGAQANKLWRTRLGHFLTLQQPNDMPSAMDNHTRFQTTPDDMYGDVSLLKCQWQSMVPASWDTAVYHFFSSVLRGHAAVTRPRPLPSPAASTPSGKQCYPLACCMSAPRGLALHSPLLTPPFLQTPENNQQPPSPFFPLPVERKPGQQQKTRVTGCHLQKTLETKQWSVRPFLHIPASLGAAPSRQLLNRTKPRPERTRPRAPSHGQNPGGTQCDRTRRQQGL